MHVGLPATCCSLISRGKCNVVDARTGRAGISLMASTGEGTFMGKRRTFGPMGRACAFAWVALSFSAHVAADAARPAPLITDEIYTKPVRLVDIGQGQRLNLYCQGSGSPTVILDAGMSDSMVSWALVQPSLAKITRVCSFDRAGLGFSDPARRTSTPVNQSEDLHALLRAAKVMPPYVMVGHSMAGMNVRVFADKYPADVVGMVVVEGSHEDQSVRGWAIGEEGAQAKWDAWLKETHACIAEAQKGLIEGSPMYATCLGTSDTRISDAINQARTRREVLPAYQAAAASERENVFYESARETRATRKDFGSMPIIVLTHSPFPKRDDETQVERNQRTLLWEDMHTQVASMSTRGINIIVPHSGHYIQFDKPQVVIDAIEQAVGIARRK
uniref:alpha/beta hydrolase n=1 Tax=Dyella soli TaxID=522319 RepID=UPI001F0D78F3|nr:alpha/beta hydrolase [Dyella soli]